MVTSGFASPAQLAIRSSHHGRVLILVSRPGSGIRVEPVDCLPHTLSERCRWRPAEEPRGLAAIRAAMCHVGWPSGERAGHDADRFYDRVSHALNDGLVRIFLARPDVDDLTVPMQARGTEHSVDHVSHEHPVARDGST